MFEMKYAMLWSSSPCFSTIVPGTMLIFSSFARAVYPSRYFWDCEQRFTKLGSSGSQLVRWYSGRTARVQPWDAASRMKETAFS